MHITSGQLQEPETQARAIGDALLHRGSPTNFPVTELGRDYIGYDLISMARECLEAAGVRTGGMGRGEVASKALTPGYGVRSGGMHTTSDFVNVLADVANKSLRAAYDQAPRTFLPFTRRATARDFKAVHRIQLGSAPRLERVNEHGEYQRGTIADAKESYQLATYGRVFAVTRRTIINDDIGAFTRVPELFGAAAAQKESDIVWAVILANAAMGDGTALFHADHNNLGTPGAISVTTIGAGRAAMHAQRDLDGETIINVMARFLIVPAELETVGEQFLSETLRPGTVADVVPEGLRRSLTLITEPRLSLGVTLDGVTHAGSAAAWYLAADPMQIDTVEWCRLEGEEGVMIETRNGFEIDGVEIKGRLDFAAAALDHRGLFKNAGA